MTRYFQEMFLGHWKRMSFPTSVAKRSRRKLRLTSRYADVAIQSLESRCLLSAVTSVGVSGPQITAGSGVLNVGATVSFTVNFDAAVTVNQSLGSPTLALNDGGTAIYVSGSGLSSLTFQYQVQPGENTNDLMVTALNLNGSTIQTAGVDADLTGAATNPAGTLQIDTSIRLIASINRMIPVDLTANSTTASFTVTFNQAVTGVDSNDFQVVTTGTVTSTSVQVVPVSGSVYTINVNGISGQGTLGLNLVDHGTIHDVNGIPLAAPTFQTGQIFPTNPNPQIVTMGDVNGDGKTDLVTSDLHGNNLSVQLGNGDGTFQSPVFYNTGAGPYSAVIADVSGDGKPDLIVPNVYGASVSVLLGNGDGTFQPQFTFAAGWIPVSVAVADLNGDGKPDLTVVNRRDDTVSILLGFGNGNFQPQQVFGVGNGLSGTSGPNYARVADLNSDGKPDLVVSTGSGNSAAVLLGNGDGTFNLPQNYATDASPDQLLLGDFNNDGKLDFITGNAAASSVSVLLGNGDGTFQPQKSSSTDQQPYDIAMGDVNGDGRLDVVAVSRINGTISLLIGKGDGTFLPKETFATGARPYSISIGDVDGDGKPDLVVGCAGTSTGTVLLNKTGTGGQFPGQIYNVVPLATVASPTVSNITTTSATLGGNVTSDSGVAITERGIVYSLTSVNFDPRLNGMGVTKLTASGAIGAFTVNVTGLTPGAVYSFFAYATNSNGTSYTPFVTTFTPGPNVVTGVYDATNSNLIHTGDTLVQPVIAIAVDFSEDLSTIPGGLTSVANPANWRLTRYGIDVTTQIAGISFVLDPVSLKYITTVSFKLPLDEGGYQLVARQTLKDISGRILDGDNDGVAGGDFRINFYVAESVSGTTDIAPWLYQIEDQPLGAVASLTTPVTSSLLVFDADSNNWTGATIQIASNYQGGEDVLGFVNTPKITGTWDATTGTLTLSGTDTVSNYRTALHNVTYHDLSATPNTPATRVVNFQATDGLLSGNVISRNLNVTVSSIPAVLSGVSGTGTYAQGATPLLIAGNLVITDPSPTKLTSATVSFTNWQGQDRLNFNNIFALQHAFTQDLTAHTATFTITGSDTADHYQTLLRSLVYWDVSGTPITTARVATITVTDGLSTSNAVTRSTVVVAVNQPPTITAIESAPLAYKANDPAFPPLSISSTLLVGDPDSDNLTKATVQITAGYQNDASGKDLLAFTNQFGITGSFDATTGTLTLTGTSSASNYRTALRSITFSTSGSAVSSANRTLTLTGTDDHAPTLATSLPVTRIVTVLTTNDPPALTGVPATTLSYARGGTAVVVAATIRVIDLDSINFMAATVQITGNYQNGQDMLASSAVSGIASSFNAATGTLTLSGRSSLANYQTALRSVTYRATSSAASNLPRTISFTANDGLALSSSVQRTVTLS